MKLTFKIEIYPDRAQKPSKNFISRIQVHKRHKLDVCT